MTQSGPLERAEANAWLDIQSHVSDAFRDRFGVRVHRVRGAVALVAARTDMLALNRAWLPGNDAELGPDLLDDTIALFTTSGAPRFVVHLDPAAESPDVLAMFAEQGFRMIPPMAKLRRATSDMTEPISDVAVVDAGPEEAATFGEIAALGNELPVTMADGFTSTIGRTGWHHYLAMLEGRAVAAAALRVEDAIGWCGFAGTLPEFRHLGAQSALLARRVQDAARLGCEWVTCETMADTPERPSQSFRNMVRLGFELAYSRRGMVLSLPAQTGVRFRRAPRPARR